MLKYRLYLLLTAFIWGSTFIFQRLSTDTMGAFSFNAARFYLGALAILPLIYFNRNHDKSIKKSNSSIIKASLLIGLFLYLGCALQQIGLFYTSAGKSAFITALYIIIVPILSLYYYQPFRISHLLGIILSTIGLYFLALQQGSENILNFGDFLTLLSAVCWAFQIILVDRFAKFHKGVHLAFGQFVVCAILSSISIFIFGEEFNLEIVKNTILPILYAGIFSSGIAFTLQIIGQKRVNPTEGSMIMSLEMVFAAVLGYFCLGEVLNNRELIGAIVMSFGVLICQMPGQILWIRKGKKT